MFRNRLHIEDLSHCLLCTMPVKHPVSISVCRHVFCRECLMDFTHVLEQSTKIQEGQPRQLKHYDHVTCPTCWMAVKPSGIQHKFSERRKQWSSPRLKHVAVKLDASRATPPQCQGDSCMQRGKRAAVKSECITCGVLLCVTCSGTHAPSGEVAHTVLRLMPMTQTLCRHHEQQRITSMCKDCGYQLLCDKCAKDKVHSNHSIKDFDDYLRCQRSYMDCNARSLKDMIEDKMRKRKQLSAMLQRRNQAYQKAQSAILLQRDMLKRIIEEAAQHKLDALKLQNSQTRTLHQNQVSYLDYIIRSMHRLHHFAQQIAQPGQESKLFVNTDDVISHLNLFNTLHEYEHKVSEELRKMPCFHQEQSLRVGKIDLEIMELPQIPDPQEIVPDPDSMCMPEKMFSWLSSFEILEHPKLLWDTCARMDEEKELQPIGLAFSPLNDHLIVAENGGHRLSCYNHGGYKLQEEFTLSMSRETEFFPKDVAISGDGKMIVAIDDRQKVVRLFSDKREMIPLAKSVNFTIPNGVAIDKDNRMIVTDTSKNSVTILSPDGRQERVFGSESGSPHKLDMPEFVTTDNSSRIIVSDRRNNLIKIYDKNGNFEKSFGEGRLNNPAGVCMDYHDRIIVADGGNHRVSLYDQDGEFLKHLLHSPKQQINWPWGIALGAQGQLAVTERDTHTIKVFKVFEGCPPMRDDDASSGCSSCLQDTLGHSDDDGLTEPDDDRGGATGFTPHGR